MIDEKNFDNILNLVEESSLKLQGIKDIVQERKGEALFVQQDFSALADDVKKAAKGLKEDDATDFFEKINQDIASRVEFLTSHYRLLDEHLIKIQNVAKNIDEASLDSVEELAQITGAFLYKMKIMQGIVADISEKMSGFTGDNVSVFVKALSIDCAEFDEEFEKLLADLKQNFDKANRLANKLSKIDVDLDMQEELFSINVSINALMSAIAVFDEKYKDIGKSFEKSESFVELKSKIEDLSVNAKSIAENLEAFGDVSKGDSVLNKQLEEIIEKSQSLNDAMSAQDFSLVEDLKTNTAEISEKVDAIQESMKELQEKSSGNVDKQIDVLGEKIEGINALIKELNTGSLDEIKTTISSLDNTKKFAEIKKSIASVGEKELLTQEKIEELKKDVASIDLGVVKGEFESVNADLEILLDEIKNNRTTSNNGYSAIKEAVEKINITDLKGKILEFESMFKEGFSNTAKHDDMQHFIEGMDYILNKFEMLSNFIESCDEFFLIKEQFVGLDKKVIEIKKGVEKVESAADLKKFISSHYEKIRILVEALDNTEKMLDVKNQSDVIVSEVSYVKDILENVERAISDIGFDEFHEAIVDLQRATMQTQEYIKDVEDKLDDMPIKKDITNLANLVKDITKTKLNKNDLKNISEVIVQSSESFANKSDVQSLVELINSKGDNAELKEIIQNVAGSSADKSDIQSLVELINDKTDNAELKEIMQNNVEFSASKSDVKILEDLISIKDGAKLESLSRLESLIKEGIDTKEIEKLIKDESSKIASKEDVAKLASNINERFDFSSLEKTIRESSKAKEIDKIVKNNVANLANKSDVQSVLDAIYSKDLGRLEELISDKSDLVKLEGLINNIASENATKNDIEKLVEHINTKGDIEDLEEYISQSTSNLATKSDVENIENLMNTKDDISALEELIVDKNEQLKSLVQSVDNASEIAEIKQLVLKTNDVQELKILGQRLEELLANQKEARDIVAQLDTNQLQNSLAEMSQEQRDFRETLLSKIGSGELKDILDAVSAEQRELKDAVLSNLDSQELKNILANVSFEQGNIKEMILSKLSVEELNNSLEGVYQSQNEIKDIILANTNSQELKDILDGVSFEQRELKDAVLSNLNSQDLRDILANVSSEQENIKEVISSKLSAEELRDSLEGVYQFQAEIKDMVGDKTHVESLENIIKDTAEPLACKSDLSDLKEIIESKGDMSELESLVKNKAQEFENLIKLCDNADEIAQIKQAVLNTDKTEELESLGQRLEDLLANQKEAKEALGQLNTQELQNVLGGISTEQKEIKESLSQLGNADYMSEFRKVSELISDKFEIVNNDVEKLVKQENIEETISNIDDIQFAVKETLAESAAIKEDVGELDNKLRELRPLLEALDGKKNFYELKDSIRGIKESQDDTKEMFSSVANVDDVAQLGSLINDNYQEIRMTFESLDPSRQADELNKILAAFQQDQITMNAVITDFEKNINHKALALIKEKMDANEEAIVEHIDKMQAKNEILKVQDQLNSLTQDIVMQIMQVFENISFEQETQDIKDFIEESEVNIKGVMNGLKSNVERLLDAPQPIYIEELKTEVEKIAQGILTLGDNIDGIGPEVSEYLNTIESIRVSLEELANTQNLVKILEQEIGGLNVDITDVLKVVKEIAQQSQLVYTLNDAEADFEKVTLLLEDVLKNQYEQKTVHKEEDLKGGIDNVNLSILNVGESLEHFVNDYKIFADKLVDTVENLDGVTSHIANIDSVNSEYKKGVNESFKSLKDDLVSLASKINFVGDDVSKISDISGSLLDLSSKNKTEIISDLAELKEVIEKSDIAKLQENLSNIIFSLNSFMTDFEKKYSGVEADTKELLALSKSEQEISENIKGSMIFMTQWVNAAGEKFASLQDSISSFRTSFDDRIEDLKSLDDIKSIISNLEVTLAHQIESTISNQFQDKMDSDLLPGIGSVVEAKFNEQLKLGLAELSQDLADKEVDQDQIKAIIESQLAEGTNEIKESVSILEQKLINKFQAGVEQISSQGVDFEPVVHRIEASSASLDKNLADYQQEISKEILKYKDDIEEKMGAVSSNIASQVEILGSKLLAQDAKIDAMNEKMDDMIARINKIQAIDVGEQVIALESRMGNLDENIQKIVSFVEEE